ncbi:fungal-specific transcription factor domain-containing protein [Trichophaea hybrida]|nr:fungal-specific transcription factor domain-containing protein [Trichophaea hybrida]
MSTSDTGAPVQKRLRVSRACEQCRSKKIKCDGIQPTCSPCSSQSIQCSYGSSPKKRGLVPGSVSTLERSVKLLQRILGLLLVSVKAADKALLVLVEQNAASLMDDSEDGLRLTKAWKEGIVFQALETLQSSGAGGLKCQKPPSLDKGIDNPTDLTRARFRVELLPKDVNEPKPKSPRSPLQAPHSIAGSSASHQANQRNEEMQDMEVEQNIVEVGGSENSRDGNDVSQDGGSTGANGISFVQSTPDIPAPNFGSEGFSHIHHPFSPSNIPTMTSMNSPATSYIHFGPIYIPQSDFAHPTPSPSHNDRPARLPLLQQGNTPLDTTSIPSNFRLLIDIYFSYSHAWFPILDKYDIVRVVHTINAPTSSSNLAMLSQQVSPGKRALLYAVLALACAQNEGVVKQRKSNVSSPNTLISSVVSTELYMSSQKLLFDSKEYGLEHIQALLLLSLVSISQLQLSTAWLLIGLAGRISVDIGLNSTDSTPFGRRTWMGYLVLECLMALWMKRKPHVIDSDWSILPVPEDGWEEWDVWKGVPEIEVPEDMGGGHEPAHITSVFNQLVKLSRIVRRIAMQPSHQTRQDPDLETQRKTLLQQLRNWARDLPQAYSLNISTYSSPLLTPISSMPHKFNLHLLYLHALLRLHQAPIFGYSRLDEATRVIKETAISATEVILETYNSHHSPGVAPCPFVHYAASIFNDPMASEGPDNPASRVAKIFNNNLMSFCNADGFEPGRALFRNAHLPSQAIGPVKSAPTPSHKQNTDLGRSAGFIPCSSSSSVAGGSSDNGMIQDFYPPSIGNTRLREHLPPRQPPSMSLREEDLNASNIATSSSTGLQSLLFPMFPQQQSAVSPDTLDDEFGMFDLPWAHNGIPAEFMQNLGYVGLSPDATVDMLPSTQDTGLRGGGGGRTADDSSVQTPQHNIYAGRGLNTVLEQYLGDMLGAGAGGGGGGSSLER